MPPPELRVGEIYGYRQFHADGTKLRGVTMRRNVFRAGVNEARCALVSSFRRNHQPPEDTCKCGIYGFYSADENVYEDSATGPGGIIAAWGKVITGDLGFRAEQAELIALIRRRTRTRNICIGSLEAPVEVWVGLNLAAAVAVLITIIGPPFNTPAATLGALLPAVLAYRPLLRFVRSRLNNSARRADEALAAKYGVPLFDTRAEATEHFPLSHRPTT